MNIKIASLLICSVLLNSCQESRYHSGYHAILRSFKPVFVNHFPLKMSEGTTYRSKSAEYNLTYLFLYQRIEKSQFLKLFEVTKNEYTEKYNAADSCLLVINMFTTQKNLTQNNKATSTDLLTLKDKCLKNKSPVPNFYNLDITLDSTRCKLPTGFELFIVDAKSGIYWDEKYLTDGKYMPEDWKHGYSKGIAMNEETLEVIYWFVIW